MAKLYYENGRLIWKARGLFSIELKSDPGLRSHSFRQTIQGALWPAHEILIYSNGRATGKLDPESRAKNLKLV